MALSPVEEIKANSRGLRGTLRQSLADPVTGGLAEADQQLIKLHGSYQQDDRDLRELRTRAKLEPAVSFMIRTRTPGGALSARQWLALDELARTHGNGSLRLTTRQAVQLHGVLKDNLKATLAGMYRVLIDSIAACGDVNRNVLASGHPGASPIHAALHADAAALSAHLLPKSRAWFEIWLDEEPLIGDEPEPEPIYGRTYLPRKFKTAFALPPVNDVDLFAQDLGFLAVVDGEELVGYDLAVGGGMGMTHGDPATHPRLADVVGFLPREALLPVAEAVVTAQRDYGNRENRKLARLKYTIERMGLPAFVVEVERRSGIRLAPVRAAAFTADGDVLGWQHGPDGLWHLTLKTPGGRLKDGPGGHWLGALRTLARQGGLAFNVTPNQNLTLTGIAAPRREEVLAVLRAHDITSGEALPPLRQRALACVALPTCPLAMAEAERYLPELLDAVQARLAAHGLAELPVTLRMTGCPNGCARPQLAEIGLIGRAPGRYDLRLGGGRAGQRLNVRYRDNLAVPEILDELDPLFARYAAERQPEEAFGDFLWRTGTLTSDLP